jgi:hypothetical protein
MKSQQKTKKTNQSKRKKIVEQIENILNHKISVIILLAIVSAVFYSNYSAIFDKKLNLGGDNIIYFSCGKAIAEGRGYTNTIFMEETPHTWFPPGYPLFIAALQKIAPDDILFVKKANGVLLWLSLLLLFWLIKRITKNTIVAFCTTLFSAIQSTLLSFATIMMSDILFVFITLTAIHIAIYLNEKLFLKKGEWKTNVLLVFFLLNVSYIYFVRFMGMSMIFALIFWFGILTIQSIILYRKEKQKDIETFDLPIVRRWLQQRLIICLLIGFAFIVTYSLWNIRQRNAGLIESGYNQTSFFKKTGGEVMTTYEDWKTRIKYNITGNITKWVPNVLFTTEFNNDEKATPIQWLKGILMIIVFVAGLF